MSPSHIHLAQDPVMKKLIKRFGELEVTPSSSDHFTDLIDTIISQQLSIKAAATIFGRFKALLSKYPFDPQEVIDLDPEKARAAGASYAKIRYAKNIAEAVKSGALELKRFPEMSDQEILKELIQIKGIGPWTAEMFLMFNLGRPDVFSYGDLGLRNAIAKLYGIESSDRQKIEALSLTWAPYRTTASRYLWKSLDNA